LSPIGFPIAKSTSKHLANEPGKHPPYECYKNHGYQYVDEYSNHLVDPLSALRATALPGHLDYTPSQLEIEYLLFPLTLTLSLQGRENETNKAVIVTDGISKYNSGISIVVSAARQV
jgi:hypothetical protein